MSDQDDRAKALEEKLLELTGRANDLMAVLSGAIDENTKLAAYLTMVLQEVAILMGEPAEAGNAVDLPSVH